MSNEGRLTTGLVPRGPDTREWSIYVNGLLLTDRLGEPVASLVIDGRADNGKQIMRAEYGAQRNPDGTTSRYDTVVFLNIGGAVTVPYAIREGQLLIGVVEQFRHCEQDEGFNPTGVVWQTPRGNHSIARDADATARHELTGEVGPIKGDTVRLPGSNITVDNAWYRYQDELKDGVPTAQGGVAFYGVQVNDGEMEDDTSGGWRIKESILGERPKGSPYEMIGRCRFLPWQDAVQIRDSFTSIVVARLLSHLVATGAAKITF